MNLFNNPINNLFFILHELKVSLLQKQIVILTLFILTTSFEECSSIVTVIYLQSYNGSNKIAYWAYLLYNFNEGNKATEIARNINAVYGYRIVIVSQCQWGLQKFRTESYSLEDESHPGQSVELDEDVLQTLKEKTSYRNS